MVNTPSFSKFLKPGAKPINTPVKPVVMPVRGIGLTTRALERSEAANTRVYKSDSAQAHAAQEAAEAQSEGLRETMDALAKELDKAGGITLDQSQLVALDGLRRNTCAVLIGAAGTGKTTLLRHWLKLTSSELEASGKKINVAFAAFTGRASQQMRRVLPPEFSEHVSTIHTLLGFHPVWEEVEQQSIIDDRTHMVNRVKFIPEYDAVNKLPYDVIVLDEASMIPVPLWNSLVEACKPGTKFVLIGDIHQLPPVGNKSILGYAMRRWPVFELTTIHRQAADNPIIANAHRVLHGQYPEHVNPCVVDGEITSGFMIVGTRNGAKDAMGKPIATPAGDISMQRFFIQQMLSMYKKGVYNPFRDAIIVPKKIDHAPLGTHQLNQFFVPLFNPPKNSKGEPAKPGDMIINPRTQIHTGTARASFAVGDKVLIMQNINTITPPITNGMTGVVESICLNGKYDQTRAPEDFGESDLDTAQDDILEVMNDLDEENSSVLDDFADQIGESDKPSDAPENLDQRQSSHTMTIKFDNGQEFVAATAGDYSKIDFGYAITCHKAQGGEYKHVFIVCHGSDTAGNLLTREWLYTAVTRARNLVVLMTNETGLGRALSAQKISGSTLAEKIRSFNFAAKTEGEFGFPVLPQNVQVDP